MGLIVDVHEPEDIVTLLGTMTQVSVLALEPLGLSDYFWVDCEGRRITIERKTWSDLISSHDRIEGQLMKSVAHVDEVGLLVEGVAVPHKDGGILLYKQSGYWFRQIRVSEYNYAAIMAFLWRLDKEGISVYHTSNMAGSAVALAGFEQNCQEKEHTTLRRYHRRKPDVWIPSPAVETLMNVKDGKGTVVGVHKAKVLLAEYGSLWNILNSDPREVAAKCPGIGVATVQRIQAAVKEGYHD